VNGAPPVIVTGLGVVSTLGFSVEELARRFAAGEVPGDASAEHQCAMVSDLPLAVVPEEKRTRIGRLDRLCRMFLCASYLALDDARLRITPENAERTGLSFGTGLGCYLTNVEYYEKVVEQGPAGASPRVFAYTVSSAAAGEVSIALGIHGPNVTSHMGLAAGLGAVGYGLDLIRMGKADVVLAGGADVAGPALVEGLRDMALLKTRDESRPFRDAVAGAWPSEGAVVAVLESAMHAERRSAPCRARLDGYAAGFEPTLTRRSPGLSGIAATLRRACQQAGRRVGEIGAVYTSAHGTPIDEVERSAISEAFGTPESPLLLAPKSALGETFGASGVLALALAAGLLRDSSPLPAGAGFTPDGRALEPDEAARRLAATSVAAVSSVCYSGNVVALVLSRAS
jgi:3-oxoacyl-[acyl-carrier-protein] synthase II